MDERYKLENQAPLKMKYGDDNKSATTYLM